MTQKNRSAATRDRPLARYSVIALMVAYALFFSAYSIRQHRAFVTRAFDLGNVDQTVWNTLHGRFLRMTNEQGTEHRLGTHFDPVLALLSPFYLVHSSPETLLVIQTLVLASAAWPIYRLTAKKFSSCWAGAVLALVYLLFPALQAANMFDVHAVTLGAGFLTWAFYFVHEKQYPLFGLFAILSMGCKEEVSLIVAMMGLYLLFVQKERRLGAAVVLTGIAVFVVAVKLVIPSFNDSGKSIHLSHYSYLGSSMEDVLLNAITRPGLVLGNLRDKVKIAYLLKLFFPVGYLSLLAPHVLLIATPSIGINLLSSLDRMVALDHFHNSVTIVPFVVISGGWGAAWVVNTVQRARGLDRRFLLAVVLSCMLVFSFYYHHLFGLTPLARDFYWPEITAHHRLGKTLAESLPDDAVVVAQENLNPHVSQRETVYLFPDRLEDADYVFLDVTSFSGHAIDNDEYYQAVNDLLEDPVFGVIHSQDGYLLLQRGADRNPVSQAFYDFARADSLAQARPVSVTFGRVLALEGIDWRINRRLEMKLKTYWRLAEPLPEGIHLFACIVESDGTIVPETMRELHGSVWYPPSQWQAGELVRDVTVLSLPDNTVPRTATVGILVGQADALTSADSRLNVHIHQAGDLNLTVLGTFLSIAP